MAIHGKNTQVFLNDIDISELFKSADFSVDVDTAETTTFTKDWKTHIAGVASGSWDFDGLYDPTVTDVRDTLSAPGGSIIVVYPEGFAVGKPYRSATVKSTAYSESSPVGDVVAFSWTVITNGDVEFGVVPAP